jgi:hypothetical protein
LVITVIEEHRILKLIKEFGEEMLKPMLPEMFFTKGLENIIRVFLKVNKESPEFQKAFYETFMNELTKLSKKDLEAWKSFLHHLSKALCPEEIS